MRTRLRLFLDWGITFGDPYLMPEKAARAVSYADRISLVRSITNSNPPTNANAPSGRADKSGGMQGTDGPTQTFTADEVELEQKKSTYNTHGHKRQEAQR